MSEEAVEQITKTPVTESQTPKREKDLKKVAAGKELAEYNKKAKEALEREKKREAEKAHTSKGEGTSESSGWQSVAIGVLVVGLTAVNLFLRYWDKPQTSYSDSQPTFNLQPPPPPNTPSDSYTPSKIPVPIPKAGMQ